MGCWNETCAISHISISGGEAVRFLPIVQNPYHIEKIDGFPCKDGEETPIVLKGRSGCYIEDLWVPLCYPIRGVYNDYGTIEDIPEKSEKDVAELNQFIDAFKKYCVPLDIGENKCHDIAIEEFTIENILEALQEGRCFMRYESDIDEKPIRIVPIAWMMIKETVWHIDIKKSGETRQSKDETDHITLKGIKTCLSEIADKSISHENYYQLKTWNMTPIDAPILTKDLLDVASEMEYIHSMMSILRISFQPTTGSGSQCDNYKLWKLVNKSWNGIITKELKEIAEQEKKWKIESKAEEAAINLILKKAKDENS